MVGVNRIGNIRIKLNIIGLISWLIAQSPMLKLSKYIWDLNILYWSWILLVVYVSHKKHSKSLKIKKWIKKVHHVIGRIYSLKDPHPPSIGLKYHLKLFSLKFITWFFSFSIFYLLVDITNDMLEVDMCTPRYCDIVVSTNSWDWVTIGYRFKELVPMSAIYQLLLAQFWLNF